MVEILLIFVSILLAVCLCFFAADFIPMITAWIKRIHIGRYTDKKIWFEKVLAVAEKNARKLPKIPVTDKTAYTLIPKLKGEYYNFYFSSWQVASLLLADSANESTRKAAYRFFDKEDWFDRSYKTGAGFLFYAMMQSGFAEDEKFKAAVDDYIAKVFAAAGDGTLPYVLEYKEHYVDTLGMVCPFLIRYHQTYGCPEALELAKRQFDEFYVYGINERTGLPVHCFNPDNKMPLGIYGWGRGCGWLALALDECLGLLDESDDYYGTLTQRATALCEALLPFQNENGSFNAIIGVPFSRQESSATAMIGGLLHRMGYVAESERCLDYLMSVTRINGEVDFAQGDTMGIGNYSRRFEPMPAAQAFALRLYGKIVEIS